MFSFSCCCLKAGKECSIFLETGWIHLSESIVDRRHRHLPSRGTRRHRHHQPRRHHFEFCWTESSGRRAGTQFDYFSKSSKLSICYYYLFIDYCYILGLPRRQYCCCCWCNTDSKFKFTLAEKTTTTTATKREFNFRLIIVRKLPKRLLPLSLSLSLFWCYLHKQF